VLAVDTNVLIYAHRADSPHHAESAALMRDLCEGVHPWVLPWPCLHEFLSVVTRGDRFMRPSTASEAFAQIEVWTSAPSCLTASETSRHIEMLQQVIVESGAQGRDVHDAKIASICLEHGVDTILTNDAAFERFRPLRARNPLHSIH
jgi:toxin-antitoxin system PIN domain toxin